MRVGVSWVSLSLTQATALMKAGGILPLNVLLLLEHIFHHNEWRNQIIWCVIFVVFLFQFLAKDQEDTEEDLDFRALENGFVS